MSGLRRRLDKEDLYHTGLMLAVALTAWSLFGHRPGLVWWAFGAGLAAMLFPVLLYPVALVWTPLSSILRAICVRGGLILAFYLLLTPVALVRRWTGYDPMRRKQWKKGTDSVFTERNVKITAQSLADPY